MSRVCASCRDSLEARPQVVLAPTRFYSISPLLSSPPLLSSTKALGLFQVLGNSCESQDSSPLSFFFPSGQLSAIFNHQPGLSTSVLNSHSVSLSMHTVSTQCLPHPGYTYHKVTSQQWLDVGTRNTTTKWTVLCSLCSLCYCASVLRCSDGKSERAEEKKLA